MRNRTRRNIRMAWASLAGAAVLLGLAQMAAAQARYHLVRLPYGARQVTNSGIVLLYDSLSDEPKLLEPALDALGNPVWDADGNGIADGYTIRSLTIGDYDWAGAARVNEELGIAVGSASQDGGWDQPVLWTDIWTANGDGTFGTLVNLGKLHDAQEGAATDVNSRGQVVVQEALRDQPSSRPPPRGLVLVNPRDTDGDEVPDLWFEDLDGDGGNDLMIDLEGTIVGNGGGLRINELGQIAGESNNQIVDGFVILPEDADGDGQPDVWYRDADGDGVNDLQISLGTEAHAYDISDGGRIVGQIGPFEVPRDYLMQWQIVPPDQVNVVVQEWAKKGGGFRAINENLQVVGIRNDSKGIGQGILWENGQILDLVGLLDNPENAEILHPVDVNDSGTIAGNSYSWDISSGSLRWAAGFIAVPIEPSLPPVCGDGVCDPGEDECNCPADCGTPPPIEAVCTDGVDNDCDGLVDCDDTEDCGGDPSCACGAKGDPCASDSDCCSNDCRPNGTCR